MKRVIAHTAMIGAILGVVDAAVHDVLPLESIQTAIDGAAAGDVIAIHGGTYHQDVTINKAVRLVEVEGDEVTITGNVTFDTLADPPSFEGFTVGSSGRGITVNNTTGLVLKDLECSAATALRVNGASDVGVVGGSYSQIEQNGGSLATMSVNVAGDYLASDGAERTVAFRTSVGKYIGWWATEAWAGYSEAREFRYFGNGGKVVVVGCKFPTAAERIGVWLHGSGNKFTVVNTQVTGVTYVSHGANPNNGWGGSCIDIKAGNEAWIANNYLSAVWRNPVGDPMSITQASLGCGVYSLSSSVIVMNNIIHDAYRGVNLPFGAISKNQFYSGVSVKSLGGVVEEDRTTGDPLFVIGDVPTLQPGSPCIDAGLDDPIYNDLDGTRNDIGPSGGCWFDPDGWTTDKPVVISFDLGPERIREGADVEVKISEGLGVEPP